MASTRQFFEGLFEKKVLGRHVAQHDPALRAYLRDIQHIALLEPDEEAWLLTRALQGNLQAQHRLVEANLRLVILIAARFQGCGLAMMDLIGEGNLGLVEAIRRFDFSKSRRFTTYAKYWILKTIAAAAAEKTKVVSMSASTAQKMERVRQAVLDSFHQGMELTTKEIARAVGLSVKQVAELLTLMQESVSLEQHREDEGPLVAILEGPPLLLSVEMAPSALLADVIQMMETVLTEEEQQVIERRFGLYDGIVYSYHDIARDLFQRTGKRVDVRIRQLERSAFEKLRAAFDTEEA